MNKNHTLPVATGVTDQRLASLRSWNRGLTLLHFAQAAVILVLAGSFAITVTSSIPTGPPGTAAPAPTALFDVPIGWAVAVFLGLASLLSTFFILIVGIPMGVALYLLESTLIAGLQAFIFATLSAIYIGGAIHPDH